MDFAWFVLKGKSQREKRMELLQCAGTSGPHKRAYHSVDREITKSATLSGGGEERGRRISLPSGHHYASSATTPRSNKFRHYGSSLSLAGTQDSQIAFVSKGSHENICYCFGLSQRYQMFLTLFPGEHGTHELTSRTLRPPSPTTLRKSSTNLPPSAGLNKNERSPKPSLPSMRVELESPKLADYLERPRLVNTIQAKNEAVAAAASAHHAKRFESNGVPAYRNLRLGNFMEQEEDNAEEDIIPERLRQYYLDTYLNVCDTCDSLTHCNPLSPIHRGM